MVLPLLARLGAGSAGIYTIKKIGEEENKERAAQKARKEERSGESGDPRSRGRRKLDSYSTVDPVTGIGGSRRTIEHARDRARRYSGHIDDYHLKRKHGEPYTLEEIQEGNRRFKSRKENAERVNREVDSARKAVQGMKKGGMVSKGSGKARPKKFRIL